MSRLIKFTHQISYKLRIAFITILGSVVPVSEATLLSLGDSPLYLITAVEPNVLLTFDDSGSMAWGYLPDGVGNTPSGGSFTPVGDNSNAACSSAWNKMYYDPGTRYFPAVNNNGNPLNTTETSFTSAYTDGHHPATGFTANSTISMAPTINLGTQYRVSWNHFGFPGFFGPEFAACGTGNTTGQQAFYFRYTVGAGCPANPTTQPPNSCFTRVNVGSASGPATIDLNGDGAINTADQDERQNFANWYSYYRIRDLAAKTAAGRAFARFSASVRVSGQHINNGRSDGSGGTLGLGAGTGASIRFTTTVGTMRRFCNDPSNNDPLCTNGSTARTDFFTRLYNSYPTNGGTPLREAMQRAGQHFDSTNTGTNSPYRDVPGTSGSTERSCRQNFHVLFTDGYWNGDAGTASNLDGTGVSLPDGTAYSSTQAPYSDSHSGTLADNSFNYWYRDLRSDLANDVPTRYTVGDASTDYWNPANDPANWQHLVTYTIGLGIAGTRNPANYFDTSLLPSAGDYDELLAGTLAWPDPLPAAAAATGERVDDLWHAALNSRGRYFSASNPDALVSSFTAIINDIAASTSAASAAALNSGTLNSNTYVYQARFNSGTWTGQLLAYYINPANATINTTPTLDAGAILNDANIAGNLYNNRMVITYKPSNNAGIPFGWPANPAAPTATELDTSQTTALNFNPFTAAYDTAGQARLDYLRGDARHETGNPSPPTPFYNFRARDRMCGAVVCGLGAKPNTGSLGDIVNSAPVYVGKPPFNYPASLETGAYSTFKSGPADTRTPMIYVGANDGMLHGFDANTLREKLAYVPSKVFGNPSVSPNGTYLSRLTSSPYAHRYFVDGSPVVADVFIKPSAAAPAEWRTILVSGLRKGGQGIFALDVTAPSSFSETNADAISLWEFNDNHDTDLGYTFGDPMIAKMSNGKWAVILAGGYNNDEADGNVGDGSAALYILFIEDGMGLMGASRWSNVVKIDTGVGGGTIANGLASPAAVDVNGDYKVDYIYAGDLRGNMWRFDVTNTNPNSWTVPANRKVIFEAKIGVGASAVLQPITSRPQVAPHPAGYSGSIVYFGTGKYLETGDASIVGATTQTFYAVWDDYTSANTGGIPSPNRGNLLQQTVTNTVTSGGAQYRAISNNNLVWHVDSSSPSSADIGWYIDLPDPGERAVTEPLLLDSRILFTTVIPSDDPCRNGGDGWLMELNAYNGGRLATSPFDVNGDGTFSSADFIAGGSGSNVAAGGKKFSGIPSAPSVLLGGSPAATPACTGPKCKEQKLISTTDGAIQGQENNPQECNYCRASWRQVR